MRWRGDRMLRLEIDGADELVEGMKKLVAECPKAASDALFEVAESFNEDVNAKMPGSYSDKIKKWKIQGAKEGTSSFVTSTILNEEGKEQESAPHSKQLLYVELSEIPDVYDILRRKEEESK